MPFLVVTVVGLYVLLFAGCAWSFVVSGCRCGCSLSFVFSGYYRCSSVSWAQSGLSIDQKLYPRPTTLNIIQPHPKHAESTQLAELSRFLWEKSKQRFRFLTSGKCRFHRIPQSTPSISIDQDARGPTRFKHRSQKPPLISIDQDVTGQKWFKHRCL